MHVVISLVGLLGYCYTNGAVHLSRVTSIAINLFRGFPPPKCLTKLYTQSDYNSAIGGLSLLVVNLLGLKMLLGHRATQLRIFIEDEVLLGQEH